MVYPWLVVTTVFTGILCLAYVIVLFLNPSTARAILAAFLGAVTVLLMFLGFGLM